MMSLTTPRLALDIRGQSASLARVMDQHCGAGRARLQEAAGLLRSSARVVIVGMGASLNAAIPFENLLCSHGIKSCSVEAGELLHYRLAACQDATIVVVSRSGESIEITRVLAALRGRVPIIGVTNESNNTLGREADVVLDVGSLPDEMVAIQSYTGTLLTLFLLGMATADRLGEAHKELDGLLPSLPGWITASLQAHRDWDAFLEPDSCLYMLGRGPSYGSAAQAALLFSEVAKAPAIAMGVASFRHGPIEVIDRRFRALVFAPRGRTRDLNIGLAKDISRFGGSVRVIGPKDEDQSGSHWINTQPCSEVLAPLLEIVPAQVAAMRLAELRGIVVGSFRFAPQVTKDEATIALQQFQAGNG
jgi:glucosamine--fructose-6-phosphate aminotransferase (isomerizing)